MSLGWMAWTWQTAILFGFIGLCLIVVTVLAIRRPETPRRGLLGFPTTRGDRLFVSFLGTAYIYIAFMRFGGEVLWWPLALSVGFWVLTFRFA
ncbi:MAG TPA: DUF2160 family membrane protein [Acetobacteraceae bacterium]